MFVIKENIMKRPIYRLLQFFRRSELFSLHYIKLNARTPIWTTLFSCNLADNGDNFSHGEAIFFIYSKHFVFTVIMIISETVGLSSWFKPQLCCDLSTDTAFIPLDNK